MIILYIVIHQRYYYFIHRFQLNKVSDTHMHQSNTIELFNRNNTY